VVTPDFFNLWNRHQVALRADVNASGVEVDMLQLLRQLCELETSRLGRLSMLGHW
jgi:hypothetical protein